MSAVNFALPRYTLMLSVASISVAASAQTAPAAPTPPTATAQPTVTATAPSLGAYDRHAEWVWQPVAIGAGGFMRGMVIHPLNSNIRFARADTWGAYRWDATRSRWVHMVTANTIPASVTTSPSNEPSVRVPLTSQPNGDGVDSIAIDPRSVNRVYMAMTVTPPGDLTNNVVRRGNVYYSRDGGRTFQASTGLSLPSFSNPSCVSAELEPNNSAGERLRVDPTNSNIVYLGSRVNGMFISTNAGVSFSPLPSVGAPGACQRVVNVLIDGSQRVRRTLNGVVMIVSKTLFVVVEGNGAGVYRSTDGGATFTNVAAGQDVLSQGSVGGSTVDSTGAFWITKNNVLLRYANGIWTTFNPPAAGSSVAVDPANPNRIFVSRFDLGIARSTDGGATWTFFDRPNIASSDGIEWITTRVNHPNAHGPLMFDPTLPTASGKGRLWTSNGNDGVIYVDLDDAAQTGSAQGMSWLEQSRGIEQLVGQNIVLPPGNRNSALLAAEDEPTFYVSNPRTFTARRFDVDTSAEGNNDLASNGMVAYVPDTPSVMVTNPANLFAGFWRGGPSRNNFASYSVNFGRNWALMPSIRRTQNDNSFGLGSIINTPEELFGGQIAISARGTVLPGRGQAVWTGQDNLVWFPHGSNQPSGFGANNVSPRYSVDGGSTWLTSTVLDEAGSPVDFSTNPFQLIFTNSSKHFALVADPVQPRTFYAMTVSNFMVTTDGGATWRIPPGTSQAFRPSFNFFINSQMTAVPGRQGDLWLTTGAGAPGAGGNLFHSTDGGSNWQRIELTKVYNVAVGKGASGRDYALYIYGQPDPSKVYGVYRSDDQGATWYLISGDGRHGYPVDSFNIPAHLAASQDVEGLVYISFTGMSYAYGYMRRLGNPYPSQ
jgi:photosystem II stability/assembly factor-like uncharacterized protein